MLAAFLSTILFSVSVICGHQSAKLIGGTEANFWRLAAATTFLGIWAYADGIGLGGESFPMFLLSGLIGIGIGDVALFQTLPRLGSRLSLLLIQCLSAPIAALIEWSWLGTPLTTQQVAWGVTILIGVGIALSPGKHLKLSRTGLFIGIGFAVLSALGNAFGAVLSRKAYAIAHANGEMVSGHDAAFQRIVGGLVIAAISVLVVKRNWIKTAGTQTAQSLENIRGKWIRVWPWVLANSLAGQTLGVTCMQRALEHTPTGLVLSITATTPIVVMPLAYMFEHEKPTRRSIVGGAIAVAGVILLIRERLGN
jgi:drug/metabolite transporter (DMT)-like permease